MENASESRSGNFLKDSSSLQDGASLHNLAQISDKAHLICGEIFSRDVSLSK